MCELLIYLGFSKFLLVDFLQNKSKESRKTKNLQQNIF